MVNIHKIANVCLMAIWILLTAFNCFGSHKATPLLFILCTCDLLWLRNDYIKLIGRHYVPDTMASTNVLSMVAAIAAALNLVVCGVSSYDGIYTTWNLNAALLCVGLMLMLTSMTHRNMVECNED